MTSKLKISGTIGSTDHRPGQSVGCGGLSG
jgi:hypothetical protein